MTRTPPAAHELPVFRAPRFVTPIGVKLVRMRDDETNPTPVLVCVPCDRPTPHVRTEHGNARCMCCQTVRKW